MKNLKKLFAVLAVSMFIFTGCGKDEGSGGGCNFEAEQRDIQSKATAFSANPTSSTCNILRQSVLKAVSKLEKCKGADKESLAQVVNAWKDIDCGPFDL